MPEFVKVGTTSLLNDGECRVVKAGTRDIALIRSGSQWYALDNTCVHRGGPLGEGSIEGGTLTCPWHGWEFDFASGKCLTAPGAAVKCHPVKVEGQDVYVEV